MPLFRKPASPITHTFQAPPIGKCSLAKNLLILIIKVLLTAIDSRHLIKREGDSTQIDFFLLIELLDHVLNYFQRKRIEEERNIIPAKANMGWGNYTFTTLEMCYAGDAIEVSSSNIRLQLL
jgi:hypothetical protein